jgi:hypothetical protein
MGYAPQVNEAEIQQQGGMQEDIGLLQDTVIRPQWRNLPSPLSYAFWKLVWKLLKTKGMGIYSYVGSSHTGKQDMERTVLIIHAGE